MTKKELIQALSQDAEISKLQIESLLMHLGIIVKNGLTEHGEIKLPDIGTLKLKDTAARPGRNPQTGEVVEIKAKKRISFKVTKSLHNAVQ